MKSYGLKFWKLSKFFQKISKFIQKSTHHTVNIKHMTIMNIILKIFGNVCKMWKIFGILTRAVDILNAKQTEQEKTFKISKRESIKLSPWSYLCSQMTPWLSISINCTPKCEIAKQTGRFTVWINDEWLGDDDVISAPFLSFWIDFLVDSVPRSSLMIVEPRYCEDEKFFMKIKSFC